MKVIIVYPSRSHSAYKIAADEFSRLSIESAGCTSVIITDEKYLAAKRNGDLTVFIGSDAANSALANLYLKKKIDSPGIKYGTDNYLIRTESIDGEKLLLLAGGCPRATIYAVYRYFELFLGCRWFWDGDRIPKTALKTEDIDVLETPRFEYRGIRYFAHRSLHRFQAEQWSFEDWKSEINWILKSRLNLFMLRIGTDDLYQKAFPKIVGYPKRDEQLPESGVGYDDRNLFWSLEYRGELRKKILKYAFERDLIHPEDSGTMTHWYSRTPIEFLEKKKPKLLSQSINAYSEQTGLVFDIREKENLDYYFRLTDTHVKEYGSPKMFHTIGLAERLFSDDKVENMRIKLYTYRLIASRLKEKYPNAPLLIASWDLWQKYTPDEVKVLVSELDPSQSIIFDYTSDTVCENNFTKWDVVGKFPWIFGMFGGYEPNNEIRGFYELTNERLKIAKSDPMCRGMVLWPELSHGDPFAIYYLTKNAWCADVPDIATLADEYCKDRYPTEIAEKMNEVWKSFIPIITLRAWSTTKDELYGKLIRNIFTEITKRTSFKKDGSNESRTLLAPFIERKEFAIKTLAILSDVPTDDEMTRRDVFDIARTVIANYTDAAILLAEAIFAEGKDLKRLECAMKTAKELLDILTEVLSMHSDFSLFDSLTQLRAVTETNPNFELTLKHNAECNYCRSFIYENAEYLYRAEMECYFKAVTESFKNGGEIFTEELNHRLEAIRENYFNTPLSIPKRAEKQLSELLKRALKLLNDINI